MIGTVKADGFHVSLTGIGARVPERVLTNDELSQTVDTSDEWIMERTGIRERRIAAPDEALSDLALPAARQALEQAGLSGKDIDLLIVATVTPDMAFPSTGAILADELGAADAAAYDLSAGCTGFMYALAQADGMLASGLAKRALVVGGDVLSRIIDWTDRRTCVLFGDGAGAVVLSPAEPGDGAILDFEHEIDGGGGPALCMPAGGSLKPSSHGKRIAFDGTGRTVIEGPFAETRELVAGFWLWEVKDMDEAVAWVKRCPNPMPGESEIEIRQVGELEDFGDNFTPELRKQEKRIGEKMKANAKR